MARQYQYNFAPKGDHAEEVTTWLKSQSDRSASLKIAILKIIQTYGSTTDLKDLMLRQFISGPAVSDQPAPASSSSDNPLPTSKIKSEPEALQPDADVSSSQQQPDSDTTVKSTEPKAKAPHLAPEPASSHPNSTNHQQHVTAQPIHRHPDNQPQSASNDSDAPVLDPAPNFNLLSRRH